MSHRLLVLLLRMKNWWVKKLDGVSGRERSAMCSVIVSKQRCRNQHLVRKKTFLKPSRMSENYVIPAVAAPLPHNPVHTKNSQRQKTIQETKGLVLNLASSTQPLNFQTHVLHLTLLSHGRAISSSVSGNLGRCKET